MVGQETVATVFDCLGDGMIHFRFLLPPVSLTSSLLLSLLYTYDPNLIQPNVSFQPSPREQHANPLPSHHSSLPHFFIPPPIRPPLHNDLKSDPPQAFHLRVVLYASPADQRNSLIARFELGESISPRRVSKLCHGGEKVRAVGGRGGEPSCFYGNRAELLELLDCEDDVSSPFFFFF